MNTLSAEEIAGVLQEAIDGKIGVHLEYRRHSLRRKIVNYLFGDYELAIFVVCLYQNDEDPPHGYVAYSRTLGGRTYRHEVATALEDKPFEIFNETEGNYEKLVEILKDAK